MKCPTCGAEMELIWSCDCGTCADHTPAQDVPSSLGALMHDVVDGAYKVAQAAVEGAWRKGYRDGLGAAEGGER